ncbi:hypothetical protein KGQ24_01435 [Patescibacteria group bacterium]|nr:hypothetical protein [Patescibacteria group bacterium]
MIVNLSKDKISARHWVLKEKAIALRKQGLSYEDILKEIPVAKSTISKWCKLIPLTSAQEARLKGSYGDRFKGIEAAQKMFWDKRLNAFNKGVVLCASHQDDSFFTAGLMLYWAEGSKTNGPAITNSSPEVIRIMFLWFKKYFAVADSSAVLQLHLHSGQDEKKVKRFWSDILGNSTVHFSKSFVKPEGSGYKKNLLYMGTVKMRIKGTGSTYMLFTILGAIAEYVHSITGTEPNPQQWIVKPKYA